MNFKVGEKCVYARPGTNESEVTPPKIGEEVVIVAIQFDGIGVMLKNYETRDIDGLPQWFAYWCLEKLQPAQRKTNSVTRQLVKDFEELKEYNPEELKEHAKSN